MVRNVLEWVKDAAVCGAMELGIAARAIFSTASSPIIRLLPLPGRTCKPVIHECRVASAVGGTRGQKFVAEATAARMCGLKGHRSVGGCRASIYNAMPLEGVEYLADFMTRSLPRIADSAALAPPDPITTPDVCRGSLFQERRGRSGVSVRCRGSDRDRGHARDSVRGSASVSSSAPRRAQDHRSPGRPGLTLCSPDPSGNAWPSAQCHTGQPLAAQRTGASLPAAGQAAGARSAWSQFFPFCSPTTLIERRWDATGRPEGRAPGSRQRGGRGSMITSWFSITRSR